MAGNVVPYQQAFLAGINHMFYHGLTYSPLEVEFPGWLFYASLNLNTHNSLWPHFSGFNQYVQRAQSVLQAGNPDNELLVYWPVYDVWADPEGLSKMLTVHGIDEWLHPTPFKLDITPYLVEGRNTIKIEVANLMANRIREMDIKGMEWRNYHEINFVNIDYGPFDASNWEIMPSGLAGPVRISIHLP
ncbi:MAG: hypothetical protein WD398_11485 [Cyclobacteriaceae bacterium]